MNPKLFFFGFLVVLMNCCCLSKVFASEEFWQSLSSVCGNDREVYIESTIANEIDIDVKSIVVTYVDSTILKSTAAAVQSVYDILAATTTRVRSQARWNVDIPAELVGYVEYENGSTKPVAKMGHQFCFQDDNGDPWFLDQPLSDAEKIAIENQRKR
jgi:hypothetical protein